MKFITLSNILLILILPFLLFLIVLEFIQFDNSFYREKFLEYAVEQNVPQALSLHEQVIKFLQGKSNELPNDFNEREKQHLLDVRNVIRISTILLYVLIIWFALLLIISASILKVSNYIINFTGKVLVFGGILTIVLAAVLLLLINSDFSAAFESFHKLFFEKGTYVFDPAKELIVRLYPEQLFMDLGIRISKNVIIASAVIILIGLLLIFLPKSKKNKYSK